MRELLDLVFSVVFFLYLQGELIKTEINERNLFPGETFISLFFLSFRFYILSISSISFL